MKNESESVSHSVLSNCDPLDYRPPGSSREFFRQEYWSGLPFLFPGDRPHPGIKPRSPTMQADPLPSEPPGKPGQHSGGTQRPPSGAGTLPLEQDVAQNFRTGDVPEAVQEWYGWEMNPCQSKRRWGCTQGRDLAPSRCYYLWKDEMSGGTEWYK